MDKELREALELFRSFGCPVCSGDCAGANPPVAVCPMRMASAALNRSPDMDGVGGLLREALRQSQDALIKHHQWHVGQTEEDQHGIIPAEAYCESKLYDETVLVLGVGNLLLTEGLMNTPTAAHLSGNAAQADTGKAALVEAIDDAVATLAAVRATASGGDWDGPETAKHFHDLCGETIKRVNSAKSAALSNEGEA